MIVRVVKCLAESFILLLAVTVIVAPSLDRMFIPSAQADSVIQTVGLPAGVPLLWQLAWDKAGFLYSSGGLGTGFLVRVDMATVLSDPLVAVEWWEIAPACSPDGWRHGSSVGIAYGHGYVWVASDYPVGPDPGTGLLSRINPSTLAVTQYWSSMFAGARAIRYDAGKIWMATQRNGVVEFNIAEETAAIRVGSLIAYDLLVESGTLWVTDQRGPGIVRFNMTSYSYVNYPTSSPPVFLAKDGDGSIWFSMNRAQSIGKLSKATGAIVEYVIFPDNPELDGPYGLALDDAGSLWIAGYGSESIIQFSTPTGTIMQTLPVSNRPYFPIKAGVNRVWCWGQGSVDMNYIRTRMETSLTVEIDGHSDGQRSVFNISGTLFGVDGHPLKWTTIRLIMTTQCGKTFWNDTVKTNQFGIYQRNTIEWAKCITVTAIFAGSIVYSPSEGTSSACV